MSDTAPSSARPRTGTSKTLRIGGCIAVLVALAGCAKTHGPSVPMQQGHSFQSARAAFAHCVPEAQAGGRNTVTASYISSVIWGGILLGPAITAMNQDVIRYNGEVGAVDRCLKDQGYQRRDLTPAEIRTLNTVYGYERERFLDQLVAGANYSPPA